MGKVTGKSTVGQIASFSGSLQAANPIGTAGAYTVTAGYSNHTLTVNSNTNGLYWNNIRIDGPDQRGDIEFVSLAPMAVTHKPTGIILFVWEP